MVKKPDDTERFDGFDDEASAPDGGAPPPAPEATPWGPSLAPLRRQRPDEDDLDKKGPSKLRRASKVMIICSAMFTMVAGVYASYRFLFSSSEAEEDSASEAAVEPTEPESERRMTDPFIGPLYGGNDPEAIRIKCGLNFTPPGQYTVACDGRFSGNPELRFDREAVGAYHNGTIYVNSGGKSYSCPVSISPLEGSRSEIHSAVNFQIGCFPPEE